MKIKKVNFLICYGVGLILICQGFLSATVFLAFAEENTSSNIEVKYEVFKDFPRHCINDEPILKRLNRKDGFVINSQVEYDNFYKERLLDKDYCQNVKFSAIDFTQRTLLGIKLGCSCGAYETNSKVFENDQDKTITYSIKTEEPNVRECDFESADFELITIPKVSDDYKIRFDLYVKTFNGRIEFTGFKMLSEEEKEELKKNGIGVREFK